MPHSYGSLSPLGGERAKGEGLGLSISYDIVVNRHRGDIRLTSRPGKTCFEVRVPIRLEG